MKSIANILSRKPEKTEEKEQEVFKEERYDQRQGLIALYNKEMTDHFRSKRILIVLALIGLTSFASLYGALSVITSYSEVEFLFLQLYTASGNSIPSFVSFIALLGPFVGLALGFDGIIGEKSERTLYRLTSQPIYRDSIINVFGRNHNHCNDGIFHGNPDRSSGNAGNRNCANYRGNCENFCVPASDLRLYLFLAGIGAAIFRNLQKCGNFSNAVHFHLAVFLVIYDDVSQCNCQCTVSSRNEYGSAVKFCKKLFLSAGIKPDFSILSV